MNHTQAMHVEAPWDGYKRNGIGRELGRWGVEGYFEVKQAYLSLHERSATWP